MYILILDYKYIDSLFLKWVLDRRDFILVIDKFLVDFKFLSM